VLPIAEQWVVVLRNLTSDTMQSNDRMICKTLPAIIPYLVNDINLVLVDLCMLHLASFHSSERVHDE
jgi:hypothetical protein